MQPPKPLMSAALVLFLGCSTNSHEPRQVAEAFWSASQAGDMELAQSYVSEASTATFDQSDSNGDAVDDISFGATHLDGRNASVETTMAGVNNGEPMRISFATALVRERGEWKIDLDQTMGNMMKSVFGVSMSAMAEELGKAMGEAMGSAMEGMAQGMAQGMESMMETLNDSVAAKQEGGNR